MKLIAVFILFLSFLANAENEVDYGFDLSGGAQETQRGEETDVFGAQAFGEPAEDLDLPQFLLPQPETVYQETPSTEAQAVTKAQQKVMDIFATTLSEQDSKSQSVSPVGGGTLVDEVQYSGGDLVREDYSIFTNANTSSD